MSGKFKRGFKQKLRGFFVAILLFILAMYALTVAFVVLLKWVNPLTTAVQMQRRIGAMVHHQPYRKRYEFVPLARISPNLQHAVVSAEDGRFRKHHGFDWVEMRKVIEQDLERHRLGRGGSTITQQLVKNMFLSTERSLIRKAAEFALVPVVERVLDKDRILELYLNVIEWGPGIYGAEAASEFYYRHPAAEMSREQAARLAAVIPAPLRRRPEMMNEYSEEILRRMNQTGW